MSGSEILNTHCNDCGGDKKHTVLYKYVSEYEDPDTQLRELNVYRTLACRGCDAVTLKHHVRYNDGEIAGSTHYYPPRVYRKRPPWLWRLREGRGDEGKYVVTLLGQIYEAFGVDAFAVAAMGIRALLEFLMVSSVKDQGSFKANLKAFELGGYVSAQARARLETTLEVGSAAIHRGFLPERPDVLVLLDIAEHVVESMFLHDEALSRVALKVPPRNPPAKPKSGQLQNP